MKILHDGLLRSMARDGMIKPFFEENVSEVRKPISNGLSSFGYDATLGTGFRAMRSDLPPDTVIDPLAMTPNQIDKFFTMESAASYDIPPGSYVLGHSVETFRIPDTTLGICLGKSSYARLGIIVNVTPLEPGWEGQVTVEISNHTPYHVRVHAGHGISQFVFLDNDVPPQRSYKHRGAKYHGQRGVVLPRFGMVDEKS